MREKASCKLEFFVTPISKIIIPKGRDAIYAILRAIQEIHKESERITLL